MKMMQKQSPMLTFQKVSEHELSTNHSLQSHLLDSTQHSDATPSFPREYKQGRFLKVTSKVVRELKFNDPEPLEERQEKGSIFSKIEGLCNCIDTQTDRLAKMRKEKEPGRVSLLSLLSTPQDEEKTRPLTPIGSLVSLLNE